MLDVTGLILESKYPELQFIVKGPRMTVWRDGYPVQEPKHIILYFDRYICMVDDIVRDQELTDEDKEYVGHAIEAAFKNPNARDFWIHDLPKAAPPWPNYDATHHNQIPVMAEATGLVNEALMYEQRGRPGGPREGVVKKLEALLSGSDPTVAYDGDELAAV